MNLWGTEITVRVSSAAPDATPVWVDISDYVIVPSGMKLETWLGRTSELPVFEPGKAQWLLLNNDDRFTTGNVLSPYSPWWKQSRRFQVLETVDDKDFVLADGYLEIPQTTIQVQPLDGDVKAILVNVSGLDVLGRLRTSRKLKSALAEHIVYEGGTDLKGYWPCTEAAPPLVGIGPTTAPLVVYEYLIGISRPQAIPQYQTGTAPPGGEADCVRLNAATDEVGWWNNRAAFPSTFTPTVSAGGVFTLVFWASVNGVSTISSDQTIAAPFLDGGATGVGLNLVRNYATGAWTLSASGDLTGSTAGAVVANETLMPVAIRLDLSGPTLELWLGGQVQTVTLTGVAPSGVTLNANQFVSFFANRITVDLSHVQVYNTSGFTNAKFLEQIIAGYAPLDRQLTGARVNTILDYLGFDEARRDIDPGTSVMSTAVLAGKTGEQVLAEANTTERGRLFAVEGRVQFHDRIRVYNV